METINKKIPIIDKKTNKNIFEIGYTFEIPIYQRKYEWEEKHIEKLINDIVDNQDETYYLGIMVVSKKKNNKLEIIDGQQRLTTLYFILSVLGLKTDNLEFEYREKSTNFLKHINKMISLIKDNKKDETEEYMFDKLNFIIMKINEYKDKEMIINQLKKSVLIVTELDHNLDLNHYFEIMNVRGEQLLQSDVVKSILMSYLNKSSDRHFFSEMWEACSDMNSYIQMNFKPKIRDRIFGNKWNEFIPHNFDETKNMIGSIEEFQPDSYTIMDAIIKEEEINQLLNTVDEISTIYNTNKEDSIRFTSIIEFKYFLLHALRVFVARNLNDGASIKLLQQTIDIKTTNDFNTVFTTEFDKLRFKTHEEASKEFLFILLKSRFLFDNFLIKREFVDETDGKWSLKKEEKYNKESYNFNNTFKNTSSNERIKKLQSLLRVTYTNARQMDWITKTLEYLLNNEIDSGKFEIFLENYIKEKVNDTEFIKNNNTFMGLDTPHIIFNYLDYLLWKTKYNEDNRVFEFEYRNSVEHFYPRNPTGFPSWDKKTKKGYERDSFGNLCLVTTSFNSKLSNLAPSAKKDTYIEQISKGSLKLRIMCDYVKTKEDNEQWKTINYKKHEEDMINLLKNIDNI